MTMMSELMLTRKCDCDLSGRKYNEVDISVKLNGLNINCIKCAYFQQPMLM